MRARKSGAKRRASRTVSGRGSHPSARPSSISGGATGAERITTLGWADLEGPAAAGDEDEPICKGQHPLEPVLGHDHGETEIMDEAGECVEDFFGRGRIERGGRLVEHEHTRGGGEHRPDGDALLLATGEGAQGSIAQLLEPQEIECVLHPPTHRLGRHAEILHCVGQFVLDPFGDEAGQRVLAHEADDVGQVPRPVVSGRPAVHRDRAARVPPLKCGTSPLMQRNRVVFPVPVSPITTQSSPSGMTRESSSRIGSADSG